MDPGNRYISEVPAELTSAVANTPNGQRVMLTIRTTSATVTVFLDKQTAERWRDMISNEANTLSGLILPGTGVL
jgi:hypothetical protein